MYRRYVHYEPKKSQKMCLYTLYSTVNICVYIYLEENVVHRTKLGRLPKNTWPMHCKKGYQFSRPQPGCYLPNSPWTGIIEFFPPRETLVSNIQAGDGKIDKHFLQCGHNRYAAFNHNILHRALASQHFPRAPTL